MALITASADLEIIFDIGINYVHDDYVVLDYVEGGVDSIDLDIGASLLIASATVTATPTCFSYITYYCYNNSRRY